MSWVRGDLVGLVLITHCIIKTAPLISPLVANLCVAVAPYILLAIDHDFVLLLPMCLAN